MGAAARLLVPLLLKVTAANLEGLEARNILPHLEQVANAVLVGLASWLPVLHVGECVLSQRGGAVAQCALSTSAWDANPRPFRSCGAAPGSPTRHVRHLPHCWQDVAFAALSPSRGAAHAAPGNLSVLSSMSRLVLLSPCALGHASIFTRRTSSIRSPARCLSCRSRRPSLHL